MRGAAPNGVVPTRWRSTKSGAGSRGGGEEAGQRLRGRHVAVRPGRAVRVRALISTALQMGILIGMRVQRERLRGTRPASGAVQ